MSKQQRETFKLAEDYLRAEGAVPGERGLNGRGHLSLRFTIDGVPGRLNMPCTPSDHRSTANLRKVIKKLCREKRLSPMMG